MNTRLVKAVADAIDRSQKNGRRTPTGIAIDLHSAQLVQSPETAAEVEALRRRVAELEQELAALKAQGRVLRARPADGITRLIAPTQALRETHGEHYAAVHHDYRLGHDLPETGGA